MSWTDIFPVLTDEMVGNYLAQATGEERRAHDGWFEVAGIFNGQASPSHLISTCLFWKPDLLEQDDLPAFDRAAFDGSQGRRLPGRFPPWESYVQPLLEGARLIAAHAPDTVFRVYLASDLEFLVEELTRAGCEVYLMREPSIRHNPGAMWRFLAIENARCPVTVIDADLGRSVLDDLERGRAVTASGLGGWRIPYSFRAENEEGYRPINASHFCVTKPFPMELLLKAFVWNSIHGTIQTTCCLPGESRRKIAGTRWPDYGFDEWFLLVALYPRLAAEAVLTFRSLAGGELGPLFTLDVEYCTWSNPDSEVIFYRPPYHPSLTAWDEWQDEQTSQVRDDTAVILRGRPFAGVAQGIFRYNCGHELPSYKEFKGTLRELLAWAPETVKDRWWIDLSPNVRGSARGWELFMDRRYVKADVVFCGHGFVKVDRTIADWARESGLDRHHWTEGRLLKVPKLEGPMTLWNTGFSRAFLEFLCSDAKNIAPPVALRAWMDLDRVHAIATTAKQMGWEVR
jgi:hypothetical protein